MKRTLLVDINRAAVPIYHALQDMGHEVWVVGGKPAETLAKLASNYVQLDYSDVERLATFVDEKGFDYLVPGCTDLSYKVCAEINHDRFPGIDTPANTSAIHIKSAFREVASDIGLPVPRVLSLEQAAEVEAVIVKPVDSFSGRGVTVLHGATPSELSKAFNDARKTSKTGEVIIEEYITGQLFSHSAFIGDGDVVADFIVQEDCTINPFTVDTSRVVDGFSQEILKSIRKDIHRLMSSLALSTGLVHTQFIARGNRYWIIEMTRRCPGDIYALLIAFSTGYPYAANYVAPFVGEVPHPQRDSHLMERITRHTVTSKAGTPLWGFQFSVPVDIRLFVPLATSGDFIDPSPYGRAGIFFFRSSSDQEQERLYQDILDGNLYSFS
ncbi:MAG: ATP-grasp domain-containing protein [Candidatus Thiodiazotropha sp. (ex Rostrolucina anterorostrata)]|nr:ATP-grasp domain-containing protein [Candidatus Thiodiazotropha sp. (ex Rostrolucina anterorostrata)]